MNNIKRYYNKFKMMNPKNTELKLAVIITVLGFMLFRGISDFNFSWDIVISLCVFVISMTLHEVAHGYVAYRFGDDTAKRAGRLTLNPLKHLDLFGMLLPILLILSGFPFVIGWAKPVPVNFYRLKPNRLGLFCVAIAGIVVNLIIAGISLIALRTLAHSADFFMSDTLLTVFLYMYIINLALAFFNLIPITPLDGGRIVYSMAGEKVRSFYNQIEKYGIIIVFIIVYSGVFRGIFMELLDFFINLTNLGIPVDVI
ncbi:site-2 protease family protein [Pseudoleptotrichia goodfellowii]|jgi:Zn-dependent proteases|uniref:Peptidase, M50 family n=1 Tax=Pseudoleptotrichia goodfellowii F0264 TaxID=596323 RepID=D0GKC3_9FUSO|nr:site-2 protease family protein [Pseudoleptotrichia goodfellowii]EEY35460.1 peptidase, M50 family [Pseudoleptotrichia goodfellowii F0264]MBF4805930.1 site-2 protease family protein [Pseudoleptotrichia goodfellowii]